MGKWLYRPQARDVYLSRVSEEASEFIGADAVNSC